jgi:1,2-diacylglycerol 3-alpha-glucosyltransferase
MRILIVTDTYYPRVNGVAKSIKSFYDEYVKQGHEVVILAPDYSGVGESEMVIRVDANPLKFSPEDRLPVINSETKRLIKYAFERFKPDVVHTQTPFTLGIYVAREARKRGIPLVHTYHTFFEAYLPLYFKWIPKFMHKAISKYFSRWFCNLHDMIVAPSTAMAEVLKSYGITSGVTVIPTGIDIVPFGKGNGARGRKFLNYPSDTPLMLTVGRVAHEKNLYFLLDVLEATLKYFPDMKLIIAGQGPAEEDLLEELGKRKLCGSVMRVGLLPIEKLADLYAAADVFVLASKTETQGLVLVESLAAGTPCVAVAAMGVKDFHEDVLLSTAEVSMFVRRILEVSVRPVSYFKKTCKESAKNWTAEVTANKMIGMYYNLTGLAEEIK